MSEEKNFDTTLTKLKTRGYWRVEFYPTDFTKDTVTNLLDCKALVEAASVHFRGWDIPHVPRGRDEKQDIYPIDNERYESWIDWSLFKEIWRFYKSGKFTHLSGLNEHWYDEFDGWGPNPAPELEPSTVVDVINVIYTLTEFIYFCHNLAAKLPGVKNWAIKITLNNVNGNKLTTLDRSRAPLHWDYINRSDKMTAIDTEVSSTDLKNTKICLQLAKDAAQQIFQNFEWQAADVLVDGEQEKLINRRF